MDHASLASEAARSAGFRGRHTGRVPVTRGFFGNRRSERPDRLPPGQYDTGSSWPTLTAEATPDLDLERWQMSVDGLVEQPRSWSWRGASLS